MLETEEIADKTSDGAEVIVQAELMQFLSNVGAAQQAAQLAELPEGNADDRHACCQDISMQSSTGQSKYLQHKRVRYRNPASLQSAEYSRRPKLR